MSIKVHDVIHSLAQCIAPHFAGTEVGNLTNYNFPSYPGLAFLVLLVLKSSSKSESFHLMLYKKQNQVNYIASYICKIFPA